MFEAKGVPTLRTSDQASRDRTALEAFLAELDVAAFTILGVRTGADSYRPGHPGLPTPTIEVQVRGEGAIRDAKRELSHAAGAATAAWDRRGREGVSLTVMMTEFLHNPTDERTQHIDLLVREAIGCAKQGETDALAREKGLIVRPLAWFVRLPDDIAAAAGGGHDRAGRLTGRAAQVLLSSGALTAVIAVGKGVAALF
jgi:hypothetical protein